MSTTQHEQEFIPERNGQENSPSHSAQVSGDSDSDAVREHAREWDMAFSLQAADVFFTDSSPVLVYRLHG